MRKHFFAIIVTMGLSACNGGQNNTPIQNATDYLNVKYSQIDSANSCEVEQFSTIAKSSDLYMVEFDRFVNGGNKFFSQMKLTGHDQIDFVRDTTVILPIPNTSCSSVDVVWKNVTCIDQSRQIVTCPAIRFEDGHPFNSISIEN